MKIKAHFAPKGFKPQNVYQLFEWQEVNCEIKSSEQSTTAQVAGASQSAEQKSTNANGEKIYFSQKSVLAPKGWSDHAVEIAAAKYFRKTGVPKTGHETSIRQMVERVVFAIGQSAQKQKYFKSRSDLKQFESELIYILLSQRGFFNSPVWFNCGLSEAYKIKSNKAHWVWDPNTKKTKLQTDSYRRPQVSACFIQGVEDSLDSIFELAKNEAQLFKFGSGSGSNFSKLRGKGEALEGGGSSSGLLSFLEVLDRGAGSIKSGGTTRRAAKMVCLDIDHPEILDFINWKAREEQKAEALIRAGYSGDFEGEAFRSVSGQNANNSVRVPDAFIKALQGNKDWKLRNRTNGKVSMTLPAKEIWHAIASAAHRCADPGLQFHDTINSWNTCSQSGEIRASNPCSEYMFLDDSACNLASLNLLKFIDEKGEFDLDSYLQTVSILFIAQDILVDHAGYPTEKIALNSHQFRPLGVGFCGLGAFLMRLGVPYDSELGRGWGAVLTALLSAQATLASCDLAEELGAYPAFKKNRLSHIQVLKRQSRQINKIVSAHNATLVELKKIAGNLWSQSLKKAERWGMRNSQTTLMAPTGTIGLAMDCETTGIEPYYALATQKKLSGGGNLTLIASSVQQALSALGYTEGEQKILLDYMQRSQTLEGAPGIKESDLSVFDCAQINGQQGKRFLSAEAHLQMMAAIQPFLSGAISKTVNLPVSASVQQIEEIYFRAWELGIKSISVYRDQSKGAQPLNQVSNQASIPMEMRRCPDCGSLTELSSGCFRCTNCGSTLGCA